MPQNDRYRTRIVPIEFEANEQLESLTALDRVTLVFVSNGSATININGKIWSLSASCVLCISKYDSINILNKHKFSAKSFSFNPTFINSSLTFDALSENKFVYLEDEHDRNLLMSFLNHTDEFGGIIKIPSSMHLRINEWLGIIGSETLAQSDGMWTCRIRRYLLQTLYLVEELYLSMKKSGFKNEPFTEKEHVEIALEYIHTNYPNEISLETLCKVVNLNRTSLNKRFKERTGHTAITYLINYRIKIACEALRHTNLKVIEIAQACGFIYDTYFIKQFSKRMGISPSEYRNNYVER
ncbi:helix-turn-helix domain-containing protein [Oceanirhabdus sp. W0125-5]|uniref:helix-turn-helix domain-containing protein n=1 Tax=Oceanirhabdus sp. W0125-5 TaxID=2999116 RepID=UPI0022F33596|nr:AraC family transcriptional regulator [Oceanirhabdus sp. W0125-5]WBW97920.1 AraC family transcriptional regulator [Oceanirhabdus sp. W0125-5]